jgi:hypothetical protein
MPPARNIALQPAEQHRKPGAASNRDDTHTACATCGPTLSLFHRDCIANAAELREEPESAAGGFALGVKQLGKAGIFLQKRKILIVARVVAVFGAQLDSDLQVLHRGFRFSS